MEQILVKRVRDGAKIPVRSTEGSAGYDLFACIDSTITLFPDKRMLIPTGISVALPDHHSAIFIYARSSLGVKHGIIPANCVGVIDSDYRGEILVALFNTSDAAYCIEPNERIAQMVVQPIYTPTFSEVEELPETNRGEGGFGSTGRS